VPRQRIDLGKSKMRLDRLKPINIESSLTNPEGKRKGKLGFHRFAFYDRLINFNNA